MLLSTTSVSVGVAFSAVVMVLLVVDPTGGSWTPSRKVLQEEEMCRSHPPPPRRKRDLRGVALKIHKLGPDYSPQQSQGRAKLQQRLLRARAMLQPVTANPPGIFPGASFQFHGVVTQLPGGDGPSRPTRPSRGITTGKPTRVTSVRTSLHPHWMTPTEKWMGSHIRTTRTPSTSPSRVTPSTTSLSPPRTSTVAPQETTEPPVLPTTVNIPVSTKMRTTRVSTAASTTALSTTTPEPPPFTTFLPSITHPMHIVTTPPPHRTEPYLHITRATTSRQHTQSTTTRVTPGPGPSTETTETLEESTTERTTTAKTTRSTTTTRKYSTTTKNSSSTTTAPARPTTEPPPPPPVTPGPCRVHSDFCTCRKAHCSFNLATNECGDVTSICKQRPFPPQECVRHRKGNEAEIFYIYAGVLCQDVLKSRGDGPAENKEGSFQKCAVDQTVLAVNLGRDQTHVDSKGIQFFADNEIPWKDPHGTRKTDVSLHLSGVEKTDQWLYRWQIWGDWNQAKPGRCVAYEVRLSREGRYELTLKMIDNYWRRKGTRGFNVRFNGITILPELDLIQVTRQQFKAVDLILNFEVTHHGKQLGMPGYASSAIQNGGVDLAFCYGECGTTDEDYHVAGFSVVRFASRQEGACHPYRRLPCLCKRARCEYNVETGDCRSLEGCSSVMFLPDECRRAQAFYSDGGVLCRNAEGGGNCQIEQIVLAVNFNGGPFIDSQGIFYQADSQVTFEDPWSTISTGESRECLGVPREERELYCNYVEGINGKAETGRCIEFPIRVTSDGNYELAIKMGEFNHDHGGDRSFNVKIDGEVVLQELDLLTLAKKNEPLNLIIPLTVMDHGKVIWMRGYALRRIRGGSFKLGFCYGSWQRKGKTWTVSAFSLVRFAHSHKNISAYSFSR